MLKPETQICFGLRCKITQLNIIDKSMKRYCDYDKLLMSLVVKTFKVHHPNTI